MSATEKVHNPKFTATFPAIPGLRSRFEGKARGRLQEQGLGTVLGAGSWEAQGEEAPRKKEGEAWAEALGRNRERLWGQEDGRSHGGALKLEGSSPQSLPRLAFP